MNIKGEQVTPESKISYLQNSYQNQPLIMVDDKVIIAGELVELHDTQDLIRSMGYDPMRFDQEGGKFQDIARYHRDHIGTNNNFHTFLGRAPIEVIKVVEPFTNPEARAMLDAAIEAEPPTNLIPFARNVMVTGIVMITPRHERVGSAEFVNIIVGVATPAYGVPMKQHLDTFKVSCYGRAIDEALKCSAGDLVTMDLFLANRTIGDGMGRPVTAITLRTSKPATITVKQQHFVASSPEAWEAYEECMVKCNLTIESETIPEGLRYEH